MSRIEDNRCRGGQGLYRFCTCVAACCFCACSYLGALDPRGADAESPSRELALVSVFFLLNGGSRSYAQQQTEYILATSLINGAGSGTVHLLRKSDTDCTLTEKDRQSAGADPYDLALNSSGEVLFVAESSAASIAAFRVDHSSENLVFIGRVAQSGPGTAVPYGMAAHAGGWLYAADGAATGSVGMFSGAGSGKLAALSPAYQAAGNYMWFAVLDHSQNFLYAAHYNGLADAGNDSVYGYRVDASTGALTSIGTFASQNRPWYLALHPSRDLLYVSNQGSDSVSAYSIDAGGGSLTSLGTVAAGSQPIGLAVGENFLFAANNGGGSVSRYRIGSDGGLSALGTTATGTPNPYGMTLSTSGDCLYVARTDESAGTTTDEISIYQVDSSSGDLTYVAGLSSGDGPRFLTRTKK